MEKALSNASSAYVLTLMPVKVFFWIALATTALSLVCYRIYQWEHNDWTRNFEFAAISQTNHIQQKLNQYETELQLLQQASAENGQTMIQHYLQSEPTLYRAYLLKKHTSLPADDIEFGEYRDKKWIPITHIDTPIWAVSTIFGEQLNIMPLGLSFQWPDLSNEHRHTELLDFPYTGPLLLASTTTATPDTAIMMAIDVQSLMLDSINLSLSRMPGVDVILVAKPPKVTDNTWITPIEFADQPLWLVATPDTQLLNTQSRSISLIFALLSLAAIYVLYRRLMEQHLSNLSIEKKVTERTRDLSEANRALIQDALERGKAVSALRESEARYQALTDNAHDIITRLTPDGKRISVSSSVYKILGFSPDQLANITPFDYAHPEDQTTIRKAHERILRRGVSGRFACRMQHKAGHWVWLETNATAIRDSDTGKIREIHAVSRDISNTRNTERQLQENQSLLQTAFEDAAIAMAVSTIDGKFERVNPAFCALTGYSTHELTQLTFSDITHPADQAMLAKRLEQLSGLSENRLIFELRCLNKNGEVAWVRFNGMLSRNDDDPLRHMVVQLIDIHRYKIQQAIMNDQKQEFVALMQGISDAVISIDDYGYIQHQNRRFRIMSGYTNNDLKTLSAADLIMIPNEKGQWVDLTPENLSILKNMIPNEIRIRTRSGDLIQRSLKVQMVPHEDHSEHCLFIIKN